MTEQRIVSASREIAAPAAQIFELIADPSAQPDWDGNDNLSHADAGQRVHAVGDVFEMTNTSGRRSEEHTSELQSLMRSSYAVLCLTKNTIPKNITTGRWTTKQRGNHKKRQIEHNH